MDTNKMFPMGSEANPHISVTTQEPENSVTQEKILTDTDALLSEFAADYHRMAE